jgi:hypothetical protein
MIYGELFLLTLNLIGSLVALSFGALVPVIIKIIVCGLVVNGLRKQSKQFLVPYMIVQVGGVHPGLKFGPHLYMQLLVILLLLFLCALMINQMVTGDTSLQTIIMYTSDYSPSANVPPPDGAQKSRTAPIYLSSASCRSFHHGNRRLGRHRVERDR